MSARLFLRFVLMSVVAIMGIKAGRSFIGQNSFFQKVDRTYFSYVLGFLGAVAGFTVAPYLLIIPYQGLRAWLCKISARKLFIGTIGLLGGLVLAALAAYPLSMLPGSWGHLMPTVAALCFAILGAIVMGVRGWELFSLIGVSLRPMTGRHQGVVLLDTSVIIDGRIADISRTGFVAGTMLVPRFVLDELQHIADSANPLRRNRGRRGLDILNHMQKDGSVPLQITEYDIPGAQEVDSKLVRLAQELDCPILTNDYNLNRVAELQGVRVLNINELANAVKAVVLPGESLTVQIIQEGKEAGQGVGYLDDGTMVVVEEGRRYLNASVEIVVTRVLQTAAGRMIFGQPVVSQSQGHGR